MKTSRVYKNTTVNFNPEVYCACLYIHHEYVLCLKSLHIAHTNDVAFSSLHKDISHFNKKDSQSIRQMHFPDMIMNNFSRDVDHLSFNDFVFLMPISAFIVLTACIVLYFYTVCHVLITSICNVPFCLLVNCGIRRLTR